MNHATYDQIPKEVENAVEVMLSHIYMQGWGGIKGDNYWSLKGIGPVLPLLEKIESHKKSRIGYRKHIRMLQAEIKALKENKP